MVNPGTVATPGNANEVLHVASPAVSIGAGGNTTAFTVVSWQATFELVAFAAIPPHGAVSLYLTLMLQHPGIFVNDALAVVRSP